MIRYENFIVNFASEFRKIVDFFGMSFNETRLQEILKITTKEQIVKLSPDKVYFPETLFSDKYKIGRDEFRKKYSDLIISLTIDEKLKPYFQ